LTLVIRGYADTDLEVIVRIYNESFRNLQSSWANPMTLEWFVKRFGGALKLKSGTAFVAEYDREPVGYVLVTTQKRPQVGLVAYISGICVVPGYQRRGIGTKLIDNAMNWARNQGVVLVENDDEIIENQAAVKFFEKLGFEIFHRGAYMSKDLKLPDRFAFPKTLQVRELQAEDLDEVLKVRKETFKEFGPWYSVTDEEGFKPRYKERIGRKDIKVFVATKDDRLIGYVVCRITGDNTGSIGNVSVLPDHRRMGVGSALMARSLVFLRKNNIQTLKTVTETAEGFYKKVGFKEDARFVRVRKSISRS
jgi:ribosomal protein S18 acetylase RimI-like enzyme